MEAGPCALCIFETCTFGIHPNISGSLSFSLVLLVLSSRNTLNVTYSDTASYHFENSRKYQEQKLDGVARVFINPLHAYSTPLLSPHLTLQ